ncbi:MAG: HPr family phosphocarrier protein [Phycisphaerales bacterium]|nr:HPr family phosphocarrier protein [Phycisphaerales bacterium]
MPTAEQEISIVNKYGLHARPAMQLVELANGFGSKIELSTNSITVDGKSIMSVMRLGAAKGTVLKVTADGEDATEAINAIAILVNDGFGEMEGA